MVTFFRQAGLVVWGLDPMAFAQAQGKLPETSIQINWVDGFCLVNHELLCFLLFHSSAPPTLLSPEISN